MKHYIIIHEGFWKSIIQDGFTFVGVFCLILANHFILKDNSSWVIDAMGVVMIFFGVSALFQAKLKIDCRNIEELNAAYEEAKKVYEK